MNKVLDEIKVLMHENGYSIEEIKKVVDAFNNFISYVSRNILGKELETYIPSIRNNVFRRITSKKSASNIASVAEFNGTSPASTFVKDCVERRVQDVLKGFLRSSEIYYNMACNSEGVDATHLLAQLSSDEIDRDKSVELTAPTTIMAFSTELSLKTLYSVKNYDAIIRNIYADVTKLENGGYPNEGILNNRVRMIEQVSGDWKNIGISSNAQQTMNDVRDSYTDDKPVNLPEDDRLGNVKVNGHTLYKVFDNLPEEYRTMIKYQITTAFSRGDKKSLDDKVVSAIDYFLMASTLDTTLDNMDPTKQMVLNSNNFDRMRYLIDQLGSEELLFSMAYATSSYIVAKNEVEGRCFSSIKNCDYTSKGLQFTEELNELISSNPDKKYLLDYIVNNKQLLGVAKTLSPKDLYVLIDMFNLDEINWMKDSCNVEDSCSFKEMMYYCVFFKRHLNVYEFRYTGEKYKNINRLFYTIKSTNNLAMLGSQIAQWFAEINVYSLSQEEFDALKIFDNEFIFNSLSYKDRILYKKCSDRGIPFKIHYLSNVFSNKISEYIKNDEVDVEDFDNQINRKVNRFFNRFITLKDDRLNKLQQNIDVYEALCNEFGGIENVPHSLLGLGIEYLRVLLAHCKNNNISISDLLYENIAAPCFACMNMNARFSIKESEYKCVVKIHPALSKVVDYTRMSYRKLIYGVVSSDENRMLASMVRDYSYNLIDSINNSVTKELFVKVERDLDKDFVDYLLSKGFNYQSVVSISNLSNREEVDSLLKFGEDYGIPLNVLTSIICKHTSMEVVIERNKFFRECGCKLENIPSYYYLCKDVSIMIFQSLFWLLEGIYEKENIPNSFLIVPVSKVSNLIERLDEEGINIYHFMNFMSDNFYYLFDYVEEYIYAYKQVKDLPLDSGMEIRSFDFVVAIYKKLKVLLNYDKDSSLLLKCSLYKNFDDTLRILDICSDRGIEFFPEYLYFDIDFLKNNIDYIHVLIDGMRNIGVEMTYAKAATLMQNKKEESKNNIKPIRVA